MSRYDADDVYCIPGAAVLKNKAGITDPDLLDEFEIVALQGWEFLRAILKMLAFKDA